VRNRRLWTLVQLVEPEGEEPFKAKADALLGIDLRSEPTLAKLADLRLHAVLADAEFQEQKHRLLGE
jgi:hypothetical protein